MVLWRVKRVASVIGSGKSQVLPVGQNDGNVKVYVLNLREANKSHDFSVMITDARVTIWIFNLCMKVMMFCKSRMGCQPLFLQG